ncbi:MAG TPA: flavin reductase family protein [Lachnospiraceae bacterium]|nr:flavin reductase family protein [Lachnospiraceae bacterium]
MAKEIWKPGNMLYPLPVVLVSVAGRDGRYNLLTVAWAGTVCTNPPMVSISVRPERYSYPVLRETGEFVINLTTRELAYATDYCGVKSGRDVDKFRDLGLTPLPGEKVRAPLLGESPVNIECKVARMMPLGSHHMFLAEVVAVHADEKYMDERRRFHLEKAEPIVYSHGAYFVCGEQLGTFGYSVKKK